jgi:hypothetical protein
MTDWRTALVNHTKKVWKGVFVTKLYYNRRHMRRTFVTKMYYNRRHEERQIPDSPQKLLAPASPPCKRHLRSFCSKAESAKRLLSIPSLERHDLGVGIFQACSMDIKEIVNA